jgi:hypothetical protein
MAITSRDKLIEALATNSSRFILDKASIANQTAGNFVSLWRATGQPGQGAIPTTAAICTNTTTGGMNFTQQTAPASSYGGYGYVSTSNNAMSVEIHDRLMHRGGLVGNVATAQTVGLDLHANIANNNLAERIGDPGYSDIQWWLEWYTDTGSTAVTATITCEYSDASTATLNVSLAATRRAGFCVPLNGLVPAAQSGKYIRAIPTIQLSATTGTAGNFGVTVTRPRFTMPSPLANFQTVYNWADLGLPEIYNQSCLFPIVLTSTTSSGTVRGGGKICHG